LYVQLDELSTELLGRYKKAASADAKKADAEGDYARGNKRFKGINRATNKQFDNDLKKHNQQGVAEGESAREKWNRASAEREKKHNDVEKEMKARHARGEEDMKGSIDRLEKHINAKESVAEAIARLEAELEALAEEGKASRKLCASSKPDSELGASQLSSCKSQGLRSRDGNKSHKLGKSPKSRVKVGGHKIKGQKYGGPLPDWS
jgi:hypothetical protein